jgi:hypothetical protein
VFARGAVNRAVRRFVCSSFAKKMLGRKRHSLPDTDGRLLGVRVHAADVQDRGRVELALKASRATP